MGDASFAEMYPLYIFILVFILIFLGVLKLIAVGSKWKKWEQDFPDIRFAIPLAKIKNVVRRIGGVTFGGKGAMRVTFTDKGLRISTSNFFQKSIMIPYDRISIVKQYKILNTTYIRLQPIYDIEMHIILPDKCSVLVEKYIGSLKNLSIEEKHVELDVGIG